MNNNEFASKTIDEITLDYANKHPEELAFIIGSTVTFDLDKIPEKGISEVKDKNFEVVGYTYSFSDNEIRYKLNSGIIAQKNQLQNAN